MTRSVQPQQGQPFTLEERYRLLSTILESFTGTLELNEVLRRIVTITLEEFGADRALLIHPISENAATANVRFAVNAPHVAVVIDDSAPVQLTKAVMRRALASPRPIVIREGDPDANGELAKRFMIRSSILQVLRPRDDQPWAFGMHQCTDPREWTEEEISLFGEVGRYATIALNNTLLHQRAVHEMAKIAAILDQIPESAAIYDANGHLQRMNAAAMRESQLFVADAERSAKTNRPRHIDGSPILAGDMPAMRALRGETVAADFLVHDPRRKDDRVLNLKAAPIRDDRDQVIGAVLLSRDVTEERQNAEREAWRRRHAECLANLGLDAITLQPAFDDLNEPARRVSDAIGGTVRIYLYQPVQGTLDLVGYAGTADTEQFRSFFSTHPHRPGEGLPGAVFQIGRPLFFYEIRGNAVVDFGRDEEERAVKTDMREHSLIACPIEAYYGDRIGAVVISQSDPGRNFDAEDLEFAQSIAERIGVAAHIHQLTRISLEGHRAAEELARREVDARVRFEAVLETAPIGIAVFSADELRFELASARWLEFSTRFGKISPDTRLIGLRVADVIPGFETVLKRVAESGETIVNDALEIQAGAATMYVNRIVSAVRGRFSGVTQSITVLVQDVTEQVKAKREIEALAQMMAERSARLDSILGSMTDGLWVYDAAAEVVDVNQAALTMFGLGSRTEAVRHGSFSNFPLRHPDGRPILSSDLPHARALKGYIVPDYLAVGRHLITGKDLDLSIAAAPIESNGIVGAVLVIRDITALQELDRKKDEFLSVASHELRTPLTTIKGYTQLLAQGVEEFPGSDRSTYLNAVLGEIERMMGLITELLDVSRIETNRLQVDRQSIRWLEFLERRASAFRVQNPSRTIIFRPQLPETLLVVDPDRMRQVIDNLLSNAIKYSPDTTEIEIRAAVEDGSMMTSVIDQGIGIPKDEIPRLFERFHRARNVSSRYYGGLGLGLYIARAIVEAHSGSIFVNSEEGQGATFTVRLPLP